jgi:hypothetical protein
MTSEEELLIEDVDLVFIFTFDLGAKVVNVHELVEAFAKSYSLVEACWHPPGEPYPTPVAIYIAAKKLGRINSKMTLKEFIDRGLDRELWDDVHVREEITRLHVLFREMIKVDGHALNPQYLKLGRYIRSKLVGLEAEVVEPAKIEADDRQIQEFMRERVRGFRIEPYLLIHNAGIGIVTAWINLKGKFTTDDIITLERRLDEIKLNVKDAFGHQYESITLGEFVDGVIATPLQAAVLFKDRYEDFERVFEALERDKIGMNEIIEGLRNEYTTWHVIVGVKEVACGHGCFTAEDVVKRHVKEVAGILSRRKSWRDYRISAAEEDLGRNLSAYEHYASYVDIGSSLFLSSPKLGKEIDTVEFREFLLHFVTPVEFLVLSCKILDVYYSLYRKKVKQFQEVKIRGKVLNPSEYMELRSELTEALEEYRHVAFFISDPPRSILECGKERYKLTEWENVLSSALDELAELARTHYDERFAKSQLVLTVVFGIFGIFAEIEFLERLVGLQWAMAGAAMTVAALVLFYRWYMGIPYRKFWPLRQKVGRAENTEAGSATPEEETEK